MEAKEIAKEIFTDFLKSVENKKNFEFEVKKNNTDKRGIRDIVLSKAVNGKEDEIQKLWDSCYLFTKITTRPLQTFPLYKRLTTLVEDTDELSKAMTTSGTGEGAEWVPTGFSTDVIRQVEDKIKIAKLFPSFEMGELYQYFGSAGTGMAKKGTEGTAVSEGTLTTYKIIFDLKKIIYKRTVSYELADNEIISTIDIVKEEIVKAIAEGIDQTIINGDTSATHMDSDITAADDVRKTFDGLRKLTNTAQKVDCATFNISALRNVRKKLGKYNADANNLVWIMSYNTWIKVADEIKAMLPVGVGAEMKDGYISFIDGVPVICSGTVRTNLNASGVYDGVTTSKTIVILARKDCFKIGKRKDIIVEIDKDISSQSHEIVASARLDFKKIYPQDEPVVAIGYNIES